MPEGSRREHEQHLVHVVRWPARKESDLRAGKHEARYRRSVRTGGPRPVTKNVSTEIADRSNHKSMGGSGPHMRPDQTSGTLSEAMSRGKPRQLLSGQLKWHARRERWRRRPIAQDMRAIEESRGEYLEHVPRCQRDLRRENVERRKSPSTMPT